jgi:excisionase family DNA binding protein
MMVSGMTTQSQTASRPGLLTPAELAQFLGVGRTTAYRLIGSGQLPVLRIGRLVRVPFEGLQEWTRRRQQVMLAPNRKVNHDVK